MLLQRSLIHYIIGFQTISPLIQPKETRMKKIFFLTIALLLLNACAAQSGQGSSAQAYGEIKGGVESSHVH